MNSRSEHKPAGDKPARLAPSHATPSAAGKSRPARKLFQPEAKPLDSGVTPLLAVRRPRRNSRPLAVLAACLTLAAASVAQESSAPSVTVAATDRRSSTQEAESNWRRDNRDRDSRRDRRSSEPSRTSGNSSAVSASKPSSANAQATSNETFSAYAIIGERNIFNPNRSPRRNNEQRPRPTVVDSFGLVGVMAYEKGTFAFFDGSRSEFKKVLKLSDTIAGYSISEVGPGSVKLSKNGQSLELPVGSQMRREEGSEWTLSKQPQTYAASPSPTTNPPATGTSVSPESSGTSDDVLKRLMQRREQE